MTKIMLRWYIVAIVFMMVVTILTSCSPQKHLDRFLHRHPELVHSDSSKVKKNDSIKGVDDSFFFDLSKLGIDPGIQPAIKQQVFDIGMVQPFIRSVDTSRKAMDNMFNGWGIIPNVIKPISPYPLLPTPKTTLLRNDTIVKHFPDSLTVKAWRQGNGIGISLHKPAYVKPYTETVVTNKVICDPCPPCTTPLYDIICRWVALILLPLFVGWVIWQIRRTT